MQTSPHAQHSGPNFLSPAIGLCMKGVLRCKLRCPVCRERYGTEALVCGCGLQPSRSIYIDLHDPSIPGPEHRLKVYADKKGRRFEGFLHARRTLEAIRLSFDDRTFDPLEYKPREQREFLFETYSERWLAVRAGHVGEAEGDIKESTLKAITSRLRNLLIPLFKGKDIREVRGLLIEEKALELRTDKDGEARAGNTRAGALSLLRQIFRDAHRWGDIEEVPAFPRFAFEIPEHKIPSEETRNLVFDQIPVRHRPLFWMVRYHPIRHVEARRIRSGDIDLTADIVTIWKRRRKAGETYQLPLHPLAKIELLKYLAGPLVPHPDQPLFQHLSPKTGKLGPYGDYTMNAVWKQARKLAGVEGYTLNEATRHAIATDAVNRGVDIGAVSAALGHSSPSVTAKFYAHYKPEALADVLGIKKPDRAQPDQNRTND